MVLILRLLAWLGAAWLIYQGLHSLRRRWAPPPTTTRSAQAMVRCLVCGLNLPQSEAVAAGQRWACCVEHARSDAPWQP